MIPTPGQKVWLSTDGGALPPGTYAGTVRGLVDFSEYPDLASQEGWWWIDVDGVDSPKIAHQSMMRPRDDPPPQQEPKRDDVGNGWESLRNVFRPSREIA